MTIFSSLNKFRCQGVKKNHKGLIKNAINETACEHLQSKSGNHGDVLELYYGLKSLNRNVGCTFIPYSHLSTFMNNGQIQF